jgi:diguanylate cyclase (GGDEF)-like protein
MRKRFNPSTRSAKITDSTLHFDSPADSNIRELLIDRLPAIIWTTNRELRITSRGGLSFVPERGLQEYIGMSLEDYFGPGNTAILCVPEYHQVLEGTPLEFDAHHRGRFFAIRAHPLRAGGSTIIGTVGVALDVTDRRASEESLKYLATHDSLTDLANYRALLTSFDAELQRSGRTGRPFTALLLDVDGLKDINDRHGHLAGSKALCRLANVLKRTCRSIDTVARYGGDEFAVLLVETDEIAAHRVAERIKDGLARDKEDPQISASVGIAVYPRDGYTVENLLAGADRKLYRNKIRLSLRKQAGSLQMGKNDLTGPSGPDRRRSKRLRLDMSVVIRGESSNNRPFEEETFTISVSRHGALLMLQAQVSLGQTLSIRNTLTNNEKQVRVARFGVPYGGVAQVGIEFQESAADFWGGDVQLEI